MTQAASRPTKTSGSSVQIRRLKFRHLLFFLLLFSGIIPLLISSTRLINESKDLLKTQKKELLTVSAQAFAKGLSDDLAKHKSQLQQLGLGLVASPGAGKLKQRFEQPWVQELINTFAAEHNSILALRVVDQDNYGLYFDNPSLGAAVTDSLKVAFEDALAAREPVFRFVIVSQETDPGVVVAVPVPTPDGSETLIAETLVVLNAFDAEDIFLVDKNGELLWSAGTSPEVEVALLESELIEDFKVFPMSVTQEHDLAVGDKVESTLARIVPVQETGWGVVGHKPAKIAFEEVQEMIFNTVLSSVLLVILALIFALLAARWFSRPIQLLAGASHEIAAGNFDRRVRTAGLFIYEVADLAEDFNRMSEYVENYIEQLKKAAQANRDLFISTIRAFAATIDAKDPYTRGHSERVASYSRAISRYLGLPKDMQEKVWIAAVLHDVGKIGVEDRILKKGGVLTPEEFEQMKLHPVIGAEIVEPISALREMIPGIRWHHEAWNGTGYPDKLKAEQIPLMARIIGVADTFDAITTTRPYQNAYSTDYALQTIKKLTGAKFDAKIVTAFLLAWEAGHIKMDTGAEAEGVPVPSPVPAE